MKRLLDSERKTLNNDKVHYYPVNYNVTALGLDKLKAKSVIASHLDVSKRASPKHATTPGQEKQENPEYHKTISYYI